MIGEPARGLKRCYVMECTNSAVQSGRGAQTVDQSKGLISRTLNMNGVQAASMAR
jgi:hypothetical protein